MSWRLGEFRVGRRAMECPGDGYSSGQSEFLMGCEL